MTTHARLHRTPLVACAIETEQFVAASGWDQGPRLFALARTHELAQAEPQLAGALADQDPQGYSAIEQEDLPAGSLEQVLGGIAWPATVAGVALAVERAVLPPQAEAGLPADAQAALDYVAQHPDRRDVRLLVAVDRDGEQVTLLRQREHDRDDAVAMGADIAPGLVAALRATLRD